MEVFRSNIPAQCSKVALFCSREEETGTMQGKLSIAEMLSRLEAQIALHRDKHAGAATPPWGSRCVSVFAP
jgi:hypothetical protein